MTGPRLDEADRLRNDTIRWQRKIIGVLLTAVLVGMLVAVVGGPASIQALQAVQSFVGVRSRFLLLALAFLPLAALAQTAEAGGATSIPSPAVDYLLGLGSIATQDSSSVSITGGSVTGITDLAVADGGTGASTATTAPGTNGERWTWLLSDLGLTVPSGVGMFTGVVNCTSMSDGTRVASSTMVAVIALGTGATTPNRFFGFSRQASGTTYGYAIGATTGSIFQNAVSANVKRVRGVGPYQTTTSMQWTTQHFTAPGTLDAGNANATVADSGLSGALTTLAVYAQRTGSATSTTDWTIAGFTTVMSWSAL